MLTIHFSHRYETLAGLLAERLAAPARTGNVLAADTVIVPSTAARRQLTLALARAHGICANVEFDYLARWLWQRIARVVPGVAAESPFDPARLVWRVVAALSADAAWAAAHPRLQRYLAQSDALMRYELAARLAKLFDQYVTFRPDWLAAWSQGDLLALAAPGSDVQQDQAWQAALWRRVAPDAAAVAPARAFVDALRAHGAALVADGALPAEVQVFALPALPPLHLSLLQALGGCCEVHVYALNPCREYWFETVDRRRLAYLATRGQAAHHEVGNRLLAAWGQQAQASLALLVDACGEAGVDDAHFDDQPAAEADPTLLAQLQRAIFELRELAPGSVALADADRSIEIHACHSLTREIEVLHDRLLALFAGDDPPQPHEILVVTPDIDAAAPLIDALFGTAPPDRHIPYQVTGRRRTRVNAPARVLVELLALVASRGAASAVFGLLQQPLVARRFGLDADALERVHGWLLDAGVHWALDADHCASFGLPGDGGHSFADGLERLFLGYALPAQATTPFAGVLPRGDAEGSDAAALGALWRYVDTLTTLRRDIAGAPLAAAAWAARLAQALQEFVAPADAEIEDLHEVLAALHTLGEQWAASGLAAALPLDVVRSAVAAALDDPAHGGVPTGSVTFASMAGLRNLPYRVVCAIGLNDGAFPTNSRLTEFDLMAAPGQARPGDRQRRSDERNVFLDLLLAARGTLHLSYVGRSVRDNAPLPPSVLVSELLETLLPAIAGVAPRSRLVVEHPLQAFSPDAFRVARERGADPRRQSFRREYAQALQSQRRRLAAPMPSGSEDVDDEAETDAAVADPAQPFFAAPLPAPAAEWQDVPLDRLLEFFINPCRFLLRRRLGIHLARPDDEIADDEAFVPDLPARSALAARLLPTLLADADIGLDAARELARAGTELPAGALGAQALADELASLERFAATLRPLLAEPLLAPHAVAVDILAAGCRRWHVHGALPDLRASGLLRYRYDEVRARDALTAWLHHLLLCADPPPGARPRTTWLGHHGEPLVFKPCPDPRGVLAGLIELYARGLEQPLYFFPKTAWKFLLNGESPYVATSTWYSTPFRPFGEQLDPAYQLGLRGLPDPMRGGFSDFADCAKAVFEPLLDSLEELP